MIGRKSPRPPLVPADNPIRWDGCGIPTAMLSNIREQVDYHDTKDPQRKDAPDCPTCGRRGRYIAINRLTHAEWSFPHSVFGRAVKVSTKIPEGDAFDVVCECRISRLMDDEEPTG